MRRLIDEPEVSRPPYVGRRRRRPLRWPMPAVLDLPPARNAEVEEAGTSGGAGLRRRTLAEIALDAELDRSLTGIRYLLQREAITPEHAAVWCLIYRQQHDQALADLQRFEEAEC